MRAGKIKKEQGCGSPAEDWLADKRSMILQTTPLQTTPLFHLIYSHVSFAPDDAPRRPPVQGACEYFNATYFPNSMTHGVGLGRRVRLSFVHRIPLHQCWLESLAPSRPLQGPTGKRWPLRDAVICMKHLIPALSGRTRLRNSIFNPPPSPSFHFRPPTLEFCSLDSSTHLLRAGGRSTCRLQDLIGRYST